jgi:Leucine-rich repeat (LRR) protein
MRSRPSSGSTAMPSPLVAAESGEISGRSNIQVNFQSVSREPSPNTLHFYKAFVFDDKTLNKTLTLKCGHAQVRRKSSVRSRSPSMHDRSAAAALKPSPPGPASPRTGKPGAGRVASTLNGTSKHPSRSGLPRAGRSLSMASHGKENMALLQSTLPSSSSGANLLEDVSSPGTDDTVESSFAQASTTTHARKSCLKKAEQPVEYDDGKSTDITPEMLRECVRKEGDHDDLGRMLAADLAGRNISLINRLDKCRMLRQLDLSYNRITSMRGLDSLYQLRELKLTCNKVPSIFEINKLTALEHLHLQVNRIKEIGKQALRDNKKLRTLRLDGNELKKLQYLDGQVMLQHFDASQNQLTKIEGLGMMGQLEVLALAFNQIPVIEGLGAMGRLRELDLSHNEISVLQGLKQCGQLEILRLDNNQIQNLDGLTKLPNMMELYLNNNQLTRATDQIVKVCPGLEFLHLSGNNLTELSEVRAMAGLTALIDLRLADNPICKYKAFDEHVKEYLSVVDTLDDEDIRGVRAKVARPDSDNQVFIYLHT